MKNLMVLSLLVLAGAAFPATYKAYYTTDSYGTLYDGVGRDWKGNVYIGAGRHSDYTAALFRYNPSTDLLEKVMEVKETALAASNWLSNDYGGKIHTAIKQGIDGKMYFGSHRADDATTYQPGYRGGHFMSYDPATGAATDESAPGIAADSQGLLDIDLGLQHGWLYGLDEASFVYKMNIHTKVKSRVYNFTTGSSSRSMLSDNYGRAIASTSYGRLLFFDPRNDSMYLRRAYNSTFQTTAICMQSAVKSASGDTLFFCAVGAGSAHIWRLIVSRDTVEDLGAPDPAQPGLETCGLALRWDLNMLYYFVGGTLFSINVTTGARATVLTNVPFGGQDIAGSNGVDKDGNLWFSDKTNSSGRVYKISLGIPCAACTTKPAYLDSAYLGVQNEVFEAKAAGGLVVNAQPNPFQADVTLKVLSANLSASTLRIFDVAGRQVDGFKIASGSAIRWNSRLLPAGIYVAEVRAGAQVVRKRLVKLK